MLGFFTRKRRAEDDTLQQFDSRLHRALRSLDSVIRFNLIPALHQLPFVLEDHEEPEYILQAKLNGKRRGALVATPKRVFFFQPGALGAFSVHELSYDVIKAVEYTARPLGGQISLSGPGLTLTVTEVFPPLLCGPLVAYVKSQQQTKQEEGGLHGVC